MFGWRGVSIIEYRDDTPLNAAYENWLIWVTELLGIFYEYEELSAATAMKAAEMVLSMKK